jgi:hypothetical protein
MASMSGGEHIDDQLPEGLQALRGHGPRVEQDVS